MGKLEKRCEALEDKVVDLLIDIRKSKKMSIYELSNLCSLSDGGILRIENKQRKPSFISLLKIAEGLKVKLSDILAEAEKSTS